MSVDFLSAFITKDPPVSGRRLSPFFRGEKHFLDIDVAITVTAWY